ncbi:MAG TPA: type II toxin-antitoxin system prevent-host-death family antitoxin [Rhizomicrobium sp.]|nr:type II toxin-antitoxin system prevent-host-death family antitoxin [Rhizomicrobium sp.]
MPGAAIANVATWSYIGPMKTVGLRELKNGLGAYIERVRRGERIGVTDRGRLIAELAPASAPRSDAEKLSMLARRGELTPGRRLAKRQRAQLYRSLAPASRGAASGDLLAAERDER